MSDISEKKYDDDFLKLIERPLDDSQYAALSTPGNTVIAAGAGSGKTQVLATRFAWLVLTGQAEAPQILTLTFTKKAAAEMYQRIYKTLRFFAEHEPCAELKEVHIERAKAALKAFSDVHIQTLDSYCTAVVRSCANRYGIKPDFTSGSGDGERQVKDSAFKFVMQKKDCPGIQSFANPGRLQDFAEDIVAKIILEHTSLATEAGWFTKKFEVQIQKICEAWKNLITGKAEGSIYTELNKILLARDSFEIKTPVEKRTQAHQNYLVLINSMASIYEALSDFRNISIEDIKEQNQLIKDALSLFDSFKEAVKKIPSKSGYIKDIRTFVTPFKEKIAEYDSIAAFIRQYDSLLNFNQLLDEFMEMVSRSKRVSGNLSFYDVTELALKVLIENEDIREQEKNAYRKIMIDEFQDNNGKNRDLLYLLAPKEEGKLFFVGDEKQSIYKFRGADVTVFNELSSAEENKLVYMTYNYRSEANLVKAFNMLFKNGNGIFETYNDDASENNTYEAYYNKDALKRNPDGSDMTLPELTSENIPIHFSILNKSLISENEKELPENKKNLLPEKEQLAFYIAKKIRELHDRGQGWNNFTILDRSRTNRAILLKYLSLFDIPYSVDVYKNIFEDGIVNDFYSFLRLCLYPSDVNAFAAWLCSPLAGLNENSLEIILSHLTKKALSSDGQSEYVFDINEDRDDEIATDLPAPEFEKYKAAMECFHNLRPRVLTERLTSTISYLWNDLGYKYETMMSEGLILASEQFDLLFEMARQAEENGKTLAWFVDQLEIIKKNEKKNSENDSDLDAGDITYPLERKESVQIMTIHKSKGLQFNHVFIYGCTDMRSKVSSSNFFFEEESGVSIKGEKDSGNFFFINCREIEKKKEIAEMRRLIYVAVTRAIKDVYLVGSMQYKEGSGEIRLIENTILKFYGSIREEKIADGADISSLYNSEAGFDLQDIPLVEYENLPKKSSLSADQLRESTEERALPAYEKASLIQYESKALLRKTPSSLEPQGTEAEDGDSGERLESSEDSLRSADFSAADFGTLVHSYLEMQAKGLAADLYEPEPKYFKNLSDEEIIETKEICKKLCSDFAESQIGKAFEAAKAEGRFWRAEWSFRMFWKCQAAPEGAIFTGSIDLIFENADGSYTICDYKSDSQIDKEKYRDQQECYRAAASKMLGVDQEKIALRLFFLRHKECVEL